MRRNRREQYERILLVIYLVFIFATHLFAVGFSLYVATKTMALFVALVVRHVVMNVKHHPLDKKYHHVPRQHQREPRRILSPQVRLFLVLHQVRKQVRQPC